MKPSSPCHYCELRHKLCHAECEEYIKYREELDRINHIIEEAKENETRYLESKRRVKRSNKK